MAWVKARTGKSYTRQLAEIAAIKRRSTLFGLSDYFEYQLYRDDFPDGVRKEDFAGWRMEKWLDDRLNPPPYRMLSADKLISYQLLASNAVPIPPVRAVYSPDRRIFPGATTLTSTPELERWLRTESAYPVFAKPVRGVRGAGVWGMTRYVRESDSIDLSNGESISVPALVGELGRKRPSVVASAGYIFQDLVRQYPSVRELTGPAVSSVRLVVLVDDERTVPFRAMWRVGVGRNMHDNYVKGRSGNLVGEVDLNTGVIGRVVRRQGLKEICFDRHPDSGLALRGFVLPHWGELKGLCQRAAYTFPMLRLQHWDVALAEDGPVILEMNTTGGIDMIQYASHRGLWDAQLREFVAKFGLPE